MRVRNDFVTNSSSSSFVISKDRLTSEQISLLLNFDKLIELAKEKYNTPCKNKGILECDDFCDYFICEIGGWTIEDIDDKIIGYTTMDNFNMIDFLQDLGIPLKESDYDSSGSGMSGIAWLYDNYKIDPMGWFKEDDNDENKK